MIKNYFITAFRYLLKHKAFSLINVTGLALGMAVCLMIFQYVSFQLSYDQFHQHANNIYRVPFSAGKISLKDNKGIYASNVPAFGPTVKEELPEVIDFARLFHVLTIKNILTLTYQQDKDQVISFYEEHGYYADASFLTMFSFPFVTGNPETALQEPNSMVLTQTLAEKYFGKDWQQNALGALIEVDGMQQRSFTVTGIIEDIPANSHLQFDFLLSYASLGSGAHSSWVWSQFYTYIQLAPNADPQKVEAKLPDLIARHYKGADEPEMFLQPLTDIYLDSDLRYETGLTGSRTAVYFLSIIGVFILVIAWINYINLSTVRSIERAKEVGVRKTMGAKGSYLMMQFVLEAMMMNLMAFVIAIIAVKSLLPIVADYLNWHIQSNSFYALLRSPVAGIPFLFPLLFFVGSLLSAVYPAVVLSSFSPVVVLKGKSHSSTGGVTLRRELATFQFAISMILITGTVVVYQQITYMQEKDLGMDISQVLVLKTPNVADATVFTNKLKELATVEEVTATSFIPGQEITYTRGIERADEPAEGGHNFYLVFTDEHFIPTLDLRIKAGRNFSKSFVTDIKTTIINEAAMELLGFENANEALHKKIRIRDKSKTELEIIGIIENYHQKSLQQVHEPIVLQLDATHKSYLAMKINNQEGIKANLANIHAVWQDIFPNEPYEYFFLDDYFNRQYQADQQFNRLLALFAVIAIFIACLGLSTLASYNTLQRTHEIGIRKVLGASINNILVLLTQDYVKLMGIALLLALPLTYYLVNLWLDDFTFRVSLQGWMFLIPSIMFILIILLSVSYQSFKAAKTNPADTLHYE